MCRVVPVHVVAHPDVWAIAEKIAQEEGLTARAVMSVIRNSLPQLEREFGIEANNRLRAEGTPVRVKMTSAFGRVRQGGQLTPKRPGLLVDDAFSYDPAAITVAVETVAELSRELSRYLESRIREAVRDRKAQIQAAMSKLQ